MKSVFRTLILAIVLVGLAVSRLACTGFIP